MAGGMQFNEAKADDEKTLLALMQELYAHEGMALDEKVQSALRALLNDKALGQAWLIHVGGATVGYAVLTRLYSLEYGGPCGLLDELYIGPPFRGKGMGKEAMRLIVQECEKLSLCAVHLEVGHENDSATRVYERAGFAKKNRHFMTLWLR